MKILSLSPDSCHQLQAADDVVSYSTQRACPVAVVHSQCSRTASAAATESWGCIELLLTLPQVALTVKNAAWEWLSEITAYVAKSIVWHAQAVNITRMCHSATTARWDVDVLKWLHPPAGVFDQLSKGRLNFPQPVLPVPNPGPRHWQHQPLCWHTD
jgi:hypothetical protein